MTPSCLGAAIARVPCVLRGETGGLGEVSWSPNGKAIALTNANETVCCWWSFPNNSMAIYFRWFARWKTRQQRRAGQMRMNWIWSQAGRTQHRRSRNRKCAKILSVCILVMRILQDLLVVLYKTNLLISVPYLLTGSHLACQTVRKFLHSFQRHCESGSCPCASI